MTLARRITSQTYVNHKGSSKIPRLKPRRAKNKTTPTPDFRIGNVISKIFKTRTKICLIQVSVK